MILAIIPPDLYLLLSPSPTRVFGQNRFIKLKIDLYKRALVVNHLLSLKLNFGFILDNNILPKIVEPVIPYHFIALFVYNRSIIISSTLWGNDNF